MRKFLLALFGLVGLAVLAAPIAVHENRQAGHAPPQIELVLPVGLVPVTSVSEADQSKARETADRDRERDDQTDREQTASTPREKDSSNETSEPRPTSGRHSSSGRGGQKTINVDLSDLVIRPV